MINYSNGWVRVGMDPHPKPEPLSSLTVGGGKFGDFHLP